MIFNEARGISQMSPEPLLAGGGWAQNYAALSYTVPVINTSYMYQVMVV